MRAGVEGLDGPMEVQQFPNGSANLTYLLRFGATELVLRRPPFGVVAPGAHDMRREYRVLSRLWSSFDRAPRAFLFCDDHEVVGADFVVMERRHGEVVRDGVPAAMAHHADVDRRLSFALVDAMAELHLLDPAAAGVADLGKPEGFTARQVAGLAEPVGPGASRRRSPDHGRAAPAPGGGAARADPGVGRAQRPEARQLPVRRRPTPTASSRSSTGT